MGLRKCCFIGSKRILETDGNRKQNHRYCKNTFKIHVQDDENIWYRLHIKHLQLKKSNVYGATNY